MRLSVLFDSGRGMAPVAGGALDQASSFLDAARFVANERATWEAELHAEAVRRAGRG